MTATQIIAKIDALPEAERRRVIAHVHHLEDPDDGLTLREETVRQLDRSWDQIQRGEVTSWARLKKSVKSS